MIKLIRTILLALLLSLLVGLAIGTLIRLRIERPVRYIGATGFVDGGLAARSAVPARPLDVAHPRANVLCPRQHEEQVG